MAAPLLPSLFPRPPLPPHHQPYFYNIHPTTSWDLPPPPVQFLPDIHGTTAFLQPPIVGPGPQGPCAGNFQFNAGPRFRGRGGYRGFRGRGRGGFIKRSNRVAGTSPTAQNKKAAEYSCKVCNKDYRCEESYQIHLQSHKKCSSCEFEAVPRVLKEHELLHFLPDELKLTSPEEIKKWREDRRKNFPTAENIARKKRSDEEKKARGEVAKTPLYRYIRRIIGDDEDGRFGKRGRWGRGRGRGRGRGQRGGSHQDGHWKNIHRGGRGRHSDRRERNCASSIAMKDSECVGSTAEAQEGVVHGAVTGEDKSTDSCQREDEHLSQEIASAIVEDIVTASVDRCSNPLEEEETGRKIETVISRQAVSDFTSANVDEIEIGEKAVVRSGDVAGATRKRKKLAGRRDMKPKRKKVSMGLGAIRLKKPTLLEKLLAPEIRREQNAILQCIHHVIEQDFFGVR